MDSSDAAADVADSTPVDQTPPTEELSLARPAPRRENRQGKHIGWFLMVALVFAVSVAISLAVQLDSSASPSPSEPPVCGGLYNECCDDWDDWDEDERACFTGCHDRSRERDADRNERGLFDAEDDFATRNERDRC